VILCGGGEVCPECFREAFATCIGVDFCNDEGADGEDDFGEELSEVFSSLVLLMNDGEGLGGVFFEESLKNCCDGFAGGESEDVEDVLFCDFFSAESDELVEHGLSVTHAAVGSFCDGPSCGVIKGDAFILSNVQEVLGNDIGGDGAEVKALASRDNGGENFVRLCGGEDKFDVFGRFFEGFE